MKLRFRGEFTFETELSRREVEESLKPLLLTRVECRRRLREADLEHEGYFGSVGHHGFSLVRFPGSSRRGSAVTKMEGRFGGPIAATRVHVDVRLRPLPTWLLRLGVGGNLVASLAFLAATLAGAADALLPFLVLTHFALFQYLLTLASFHSEVDTCRDALRKLF
jgi:hypothetical protein